MFQDIVVPVARDLEPLSDQKSISRLVGRRGCMLAAVDFDDETFLKTDEVEDVVFKRDLPAKLEGCQPAIAQQPPHPGFRIGWLAAHRLRKCAQAWLDGSMVRVLQGASHYDFNITFERSPTSSLLPLREKVPSRSEGG